MSLLTSEDIGLKLLSFLTQSFQIWVKQFSLPLILVKLSEVLCNKVFWNLLVLLIYWLRYTTFNGTFNIEVCSCNNGSGLSFFIRFSNDSYVMFLIVHFLLENIILDLTQNNDFSLGFSGVSW